MRKQIAWLWENMDAVFHRRHIAAICISVLTSLMLLVNPALSQRLIDDVIVAQNPEPLLPILGLMLAMKLGREGLRYLMVMFLETSSQNVMYNLRRRLFTRMQYNDMQYFHDHRTGDLMTRMSADLDWCRHFISFIDGVPGHRQLEADPPADRDHAGAAPDHQILFPPRAPAVRFHA